MKRMIAILLVAVMLACMLPAASLAATKYATVVGGWLRLRAAASFNADTVTSYYTGTRVEVLSKSGGWCHVRTPDGRTGYMYSQYLSMESGFEPTGSENAWVTSHNGYGVRLRKGPGTGYRVIRTYDVGTPVTVLQRGSYWCKINVGGTVGYMMTQFLNFGGYTPDDGSDSVICYATIWSRNGYGVRLRTGPGTNYGKIGVYSVGTTVAVLQKGTTWDRIRVGSRVGWMMNEYLIFGATGSSSGSGDNVTGVANATVTSGNGLRVWLRATAGGKRLALYSPGTGVKVLEYGDNWCRVSIGGAIGYMMTDFLAFEKAPEPGSLKLTAASLNYDYPVVGDVMEVITTPADATVKYSWKVDGVELGTEETFNVLTRYANQRISVTVTGIGAYAGSVTDTALADVQISRAMKSVALSTTSPVVGDVISAIIQPSSAVVEYSWRVAGVEVSTDATYTVTESDIGKLIQLKVKGIDGYEGSVACTAAENVTSDKAVQSVELSKEYPVVGEVVTAKVTPASAAVAYTWTVDGEVVSQTSSYKVDFYDLGKQVKVTVEGVDPYTGTASDITKRVAAAELTGVRIAPTTPVTGDTLYAYVTPSNATAEYEWYRNDEETPFATGSSSLYVSPSTVICRSSMASSNADWVLGVARLISSAKMI